MAGAIQARMKKSMRGCALDCWGVQERGGTSAPMHASTAKASGAAQQQARTVHLRQLRHVRTEQPQQPKSGVERGRVRFGGSPCHAVTARPSLAAYGTRPRRGSMRSTSATCRCSPMPSRGGRSMRDARIGGRGACHEEDRLGVDGGDVVFPVRARAGMYPLSRDHPRPEGC